MAVVNNTCEFCGERKGYENLERVTLTGAPVKYKQIPNPLNAKMPDVTVPDGDTRLVCMTCKPKLVYRKRRRAKKAQDEPELFT